MTNEQLCEHYGFKAHQYGFFNQWQDITANKMKQEPSLIEQRFTVKFSTNFFPYRS
jgi:hypothetical protein